MSSPTLPGSLAGKRGLVLGIANEHSIAIGCARAFAAHGAVRAATYVNDKARPYVEAVTDKLPCEIVLPCDVEAPGQLEAVFEDITQRWGGLDFFLRSIAPAADPRGRMLTGTILPVDGGEHLLGA